MLEIGDVAAEKFRMILCLLESFAKIWHVDEFLEDIFGFRVIKQGNGLT